jgi:hypothetical protein
MIHIHAFGEWLDPLPEGSRPADILFVIGGIPPLTDDVKIPLFLTRREKLFQVVRFALRQVARLDCLRI